MKYSEAKHGRVFVLRLEDGEILHKTIEQFAEQKDIQSAGVLLVGGADKNSELVVGPEDGTAENPIPMSHILQNVHEMAGVGTIFPNQEGQPKLHMHMTGGREGSAVTGCVRRGVKTWVIGEVIIYEIKATTAKRKYDPETGFTLLNP